MLRRLVRASVPSVQRVALAVALAAWLLVPSARAEEPVGEIALAWAAALQNRDLAGYLATLVPTGFRYRGKLVSTDAVEVTFDRAEEERATATFFKGVLVLAADVRVVKVAGDDAHVALDLDLWDAFEKGARDRFRYRVKTLVRLRTAVTPAGRRIVAAFEELPRSRDGGPTPSLALVKYIHSGLYEAQRRTEHPRKGVEDETDTLVDRVRRRAVLQIRLRSVNVPSSPPFVKTETTLRDAAGRGVENVVDYP